MPLNNIDFPDPAATPFLDDNGYTWDWDVTKWVRRTKNVPNEAPVDGVAYVRKDAAWVEGVEDDPGALDALYARKNGGWQEVVDVGSGITDAPSDGTAYSRKDAAWVHPTVADFPTLTASFAAKSDVGHGHTLADISDSGAMAAVADAPDASNYARKLGAWVPIAPASGIMFNSAITIMAPQSTDDGTLFFTKKAITIQDVNAHIVGAGSSAVVNIHFGATRNGASTKVFTADKTVNSEAGQALTMDNASIPINSWIWLDVVSVAVDPEMLHITVNYSQD